MIFQVRIYLSLSHVGQADLPQVLEEEQTDSESVYRALVGLGNVVSH